MENYKHESGLEFDFGYVNGHDITVILLYTGDDFEHGHYDPYLVGYWSGTVEYMTEDDAKHVIDEWLADKSEADIQHMLELQAAFDAEYGTK